MKKKIYNIVKKLKKKKIKKSGLHFFLGENVVRGRLKSYKLIDNIRLNINYNYKGEEGMSKIKVHTRIMEREGEIY